MRLDVRALIVNKNVLVVFPRLTGVNVRSNAIYLDHQATSELAPGVLEAMIPYFSVTYANPHSNEHAHGWHVSNAVERARAQIAAAVGADPDEVLFTSGATEANNIVILGFDRVCNPCLITSAVEHKSVLAPVRERARQGSRTTILAVDRRGRINFSDLKAALTSNVGLVTVMAVNNEIGSSQPISRIAELCHSFGALLHVDAAQALPFAAINAVASSADFISLSAHKAGGPKGIGALVVARHARNRLSPVLFGGGQEDGLRPGTLPAPLCVGFGAACAALPTTEEVADWRSRADRLSDLLRSAVPGLVRNGGGDDAHPGNVSVTLPSGEAEALIARLQPELAISTGSACTSGIPERSHVLCAIGLDAATADRTIRFSVGRFTPAEEIEKAACLFRAVAQQQD